jgi:hypothetical protein
LPELRDFDTTINISKVTLSQALRFGYERDYFGMLAEPASGIVTRYRPDSPDVYVDYDDLGPLGAISKVAPNYACGLIFVDGLFSSLLFDLSSKFLCVYQALAHTRPGQDEDVLLPSINDYRTYIRSVKTGHLELDEPATKYGDKVSVMAYLGCFFTLLHETVHLQDKPLEESLGERASRLATGGPHQRRLFQKTFEETVADLAASEWLMKSTGDRVFPKGWTVNDFLFWLPLSVSHLFIALGAMEDPERRYVSRPPAAMRFEHLKSWLKLWPKNHLWEVGTDFLWKYLADHDIAQDARLQSLRAKSAA